MADHHQQTRLALIGAGRMGVTHIEAIAGSAELALVAVIDPSENARARAREVAGPVATFPDLEAALAAAPIDAVLIAAPSTLHRALVTACAQRSLPMLCEKPCGTTVAEIDAAGAVAAGAGVVLQIGYWRRYVPALIELRETIAAGELGELSLISCWQWDAAPASPELAQKYGYDKSVEGLIITHVDDDSPATTAGLEEGDLIQSYIKDKKLQPATDAKAFEDFAAKHD